MAARSGVLLVARLLRRTPLHPQWLLEPRRPPSGLAKIAGNVLDIGAADRWLQAHVGPAGRYIALDYPTTGRDRYGARPDVFGDGARLPFSDASVDAVTCLEVLEHVPEPALVLAEIERVLRPGGRVWLSMPFLYPLHDLPHDFQRHTAGGLRRDLGRAGLEVLAVRPTGSSIRTAGLLASLAVSGGLYEKGGARLLLIAVAMPLILFINLSSWVLSWIWPNWTGMCAGHDVEGRKP